jgi:CMP-N,N'-diacetyllegionaminic acid synthase
MMKKEKEKKNNIKVVALIPARGGSKGIKSKNLYPLCSKPLISWTIKSAKKEKMINRVFISTDNSNIALQAKKYGAEIHKRPKKYATDKSLIYETINCFLKYLRHKLNYMPDVLVLLEPTCPLRKKNLIAKCIKKLLKKNYDTIATFSKAKTDPRKIWNISKNEKPSAFYKNEVWLPRQKLNSTYQLNGLLYGFNFQNKKNVKKNLLYGNSTSYVTSNVSNVDINSEEDMQYAEYIIKKRKNKK